MTRSHYRVSIQRRSIGWIFTATAISVMIQHGSTIEDAFDRCYKLRPVMVPNRLILKLFDDALDLNGELASYGEQWIKQHIDLHHLENFKETPKGD